MSYQNACVIVPIVRLLGFLLLITVTLCSCQKTLEKQVHSQIRTLGGADLDSDSVEVVRVRKSGEQAIAEVNIKTAFRLRKEGNDWVLLEVRLADRHWESVDRILAAIEESRHEQTTDQLDQITNGINKYRQAEGEVPRVESFEELVDTLNPEFLPVVVRIDAWWNPMRYKATTDSEFELRSAGPDGRFGTEDDLVRN